MLDFSKFTFNKRTLSAIGYWAAQLPSISRP